MNGVTPLKPPEPEGPRPLESESETIYAQHAVLTVLETECGEPHFDREIRHGLADAALNLSSQLKSKL